MMAPKPRLVEFSLAMNLAPGRSRDAAAWFAPGEEIERWLDEITQWNVSLVDAQLYVLPSGIDDPRPCGVLVVLKAGKPSVSAALPYAQLENRLFYPLDARLDPEISPQELRENLLWDVQVLHPAAGLVGFRAEDAIAVESLLAPPPRRPADWSRAEAGISQRPPLVSVLAAALPSMQEILDMGRDDIGSGVEETLPPAPDESPLRDAMGHAVRKAVQPLMKALVRLLSGRSSPPAKGPSAAKGAKPPRQAGPLRRWATAKLKAIDEALQERRNRELNRLLKLLQSDPDTGLQFALPLRDVASRGVAPPSDSLGRRSVDFNLSKLFGGDRPSDNWAVPGDLQKQLRDRYRESANRELNLGRFSRAAYIFAHLLGDFGAAADALKRGRLFREAAAIYQSQLKNPRAAADCLTEGGLLLEAIPLYRSLQLHETAAGLHERLGQMEESRECYRQAVAQLLHRNDVLAAALLLERKLAEPDQAMALLASTWPESNKAGICLREWFAMCGRLGRHDDAISRVAALRDRPSPSALNLTLVQSFCSVASGYPNPNVRARSADGARVLAGNRLSSADASERRALVTAVTALVPADQLLARDGNRFLSSVNSKPAPAPRTTPIAVKGSPTLARSFRLIESHEVRTVVSIPGGFLALGTRGMRCTLVRGVWDGRTVSASCSLPQIVRNYLLLAPGHGSDAVLAALKVGFDHRIGPFNLPRIDVFQDAMIVDTPAYMDSTCVGACRDENGTTWVLHGGDAADMTLAGCAAAGTVLSSHSISLESGPIENAALPVPMAARKGKVFIGRGNQLIRFDAASSRSTVIELPFPVRRLTPNPPFTVSRMIAAFDSGCAVVQESGEYQFIALDLADVVTCFTPEGSIVAIGGGKGHIYRRSGAKLAFLSAFDVSRVPIAVLPAGNSEVAVFDSQGAVDVYRLGAQ